MTNQQISEDEAAYAAGLDGEWKTVFFDDCTGDYRDKWFLTLLNPTRPGVPVKSLKAKLLDATDGARAAAVVTEVYI